MPERNELSDHVSDHLIFRLRRGKDNTNICHNPRVSMCYQLS